MLHRVDQSAITWLDRIAEQRAGRATSSLAERDASKAFVPGRSFPCEGCGQFAFKEPTLCFWCQRTSPFAKSLIEAHDGIR